MLRRIDDPRDLLMTRIVGRVDEVAAREEPGNRKGAGETSVARSAASKFKGRRKKERATLEVTLLVFNSLFRSKWENVLRLEAFRALRGLELDLCTFGERAESASFLNGGVVDENVFARFGGNETKTLCVVEPLDSTGASHLL